MVTYCPECGGRMGYEPGVKRFICGSCGLYITREELEELRSRVEVEEEDERKKRHGEYLEWWLKGKK